MISQMESFEGKRRKSKNADGMSFKKSEKVVISVLTT